MKFELAGKKFNRLIAIEYINGFWICLCDCGERTKLITHVLISGKTKSCGCLRKEKIRENQKLSIKTIRKYTPSIASARRIWRSYIYRDKNCNIDFNEFYSLSQKNCNYCNTIPNNEYNYFLKKKNASIFSKENGSFTYNGLDRVDNTQDHIIDNCVPCCWVCNRAKNSRTLDEFKQYINNLKINYIEHFKYISIELPSNIYILQSVKSAYRTYHREQISLKEFYSLSQLPCFYCSVVNSNKVNAPLIDKKASQKAKTQGWFNYNGLDRIDSTKKHTLDNCVPCCKFCNFAKSKLSFEEFQSWINRIKTKMGS